MPTTTSEYGLLLPLVNNATDSDLWGGYLNTSLTDLDGLMLTAMNWTATAETTTITVTAPTTGSTTTGSAKLLYLCTATGGAFAANLPAASTCSGMTVAFKKVDSSANTVTVTPNGSDTIEGAASFILSAQYSYTIVVSNGTSWNIIATSVVAAGRLLNIQTFTSGGTYTPTVGTNTIKVTAIGGGGGGGGVDGAGGTGGATSFGALLVCNGGVGSTGINTQGIGGVGGSCSAGTIKLTGAGGGSAGYFSASFGGIGGNGGSGIFGTGAGIGGAANSNGVAAATNSGAGGGGAGSQGTGLTSMGGGGGGGFGIYYGAASSQTVTIGAAGSAGTGTPVGGAGGTGFLMVEEFS